MLILLYGEDTFRLKQKLNEIVKKYQAKHQSGLNLIRFSGKDLDFDKLKTSIEAVSMFNEKKLVILENILISQKNTEQFLAYFKKSKLKDSQETIVVLCQPGKLTDNSLKRQADMLEEFKPLTGVHLVNWIKKRVQQAGAGITKGAITKLVVYLGNDLWQLNNELAKLASYQQGQLIDEQEIDLLVKAKIDSNIFKTLDALAQRDKKTAWRLLHQHFHQGENEIYLLSMFIYQVRNLIRLKDLIERGVPFYHLAKQSGLHPFVVKKSVQPIKNFSLGQLKNIYQRLLEIEIGLKRGRFDGPTALDILIAEI